MTIQAVSGGIVATIVLGEGNQLRGAGYIIPPIDRVINGYGWDQPDQDQLHFEVVPNLTMPIIQDIPVRVFMAKSIQDRLAQYDTSMPSGVYPGKMWKREITRLDGSKELHLMWYDTIPDKPDMCAIKHVPIVLFEVLNLLNPEAWGAVNPDSKW